ncbi:hypothetical protein D1818_13795 [Aquimarina sp. BL5]|uniref:hypothetical protein n=1 Tax=Aquimarina sp. BL5 TaxID=1714860 RepID=UPI000E531077|nr:hypothetical protein [Aquimarina sp. BL5]AXT51864.1 hypothetical protein D1818_13795 [Aquimarina sp. BL5]RKN04930.1 hypothetical protein D7036_11495 [Aquimarina sp. BL5]
MNKRIINTILLLSLLFVNTSCKNQETDQLKSSFDKKETNKDTTSNPNCFTKNDIVKLNNHYGEIEKILKQGGSFDLGNSIVFYTKKHSGLILRKLKESTCSARPIEFSGKCLENISFYIDYKEVFETDDGEHLSEETYEIILSKKNNKFFSKASL